MLRERYGHLSWGASGVVLFNVSLVFFVYRRLAQRWQLSNAGYSQKQPDSDDEDEPNSILTANWVDDIDTAARPTAKKEKVYFLGREYDSWADAYACRAGAGACSTAPDMAPEDRVSCVSFTV